MIFVSFQLVMSVEAALVVKLNVGGIYYSTTPATLTRYNDSRLPELLMSPDDVTGGGSDGTSPLVVGKDANGHRFVDRDGELFRYVLDYARIGTVILPGGFTHRRRLLFEAEFFRLSGMVSELATAGDSEAGEPVGAMAGARVPGYLLVGYRGTFGFSGRGADAHSDTRFRKISRILVCGRVSLCRETFRDTLNESRDPDRGSVDRYSARFYLKHAFIEQAFDALQAAGFRLVGACGTGMSCTADRKSMVADSDENKWNHYNEFVFCRP